MARTKRWNVDDIIATGNGPAATVEIAAGDEGFTSSSCGAWRPVDQTHPADIFEILLGLAETSALIMGLGNIAGPGLALAEYFANRGIENARD